MRSPVRLIVILLLSSLACPIFSQAQSDSSLYSKAFYLPDKLFSSIEKKSDALQDRMLRASLRYLDRLQKQERTVTVLKVYYATREAMKREKAKELYDEIHPDNSGKYTGGAGASFQWGEPVPKAQRLPETPFPKSEQEKKIDKLNEEADSYNKKYVIASSVEETLGSLTIEGVAKDKALDLMNNVIEDVQKSYAKAKDKDKFDVPEETKKAFLNRLNELIDTVVNKKHSKKKYIINV